MFFNKKSYSSRESGNVFFFIVLGIVLFGALSYTVVNTSDNSSTTLLTENKAKISQGEIDAYSADLNAGKTQLQLDGCTNIDYTPPANQVAGNKSCHMFHADGAGVKYRPIIAACEYSNDPCLEDLEIGESVGGIVYAGEVGGERLYTASTDVGSFTWNDGSTTFSVPAGYVDIGGAESTSDGAANTDAILAVTGGNEPYQAAVACRALGSEWYLPSRDELTLLYNNQNDIGNFTTGIYWSSTQASGDPIRAIRVHFGGVLSYTNSPKDFNLRVRCVRKG